MQLQRVPGNYGEQIKDNVLSVHSEVNVAP